MQVCAQTDHLGKSSVKIWNSSSGLCLVENSMKINAWNIYVFTSSAQIHSQTRVHVYQSNQTPLSRSPAVLISRKRSVSDIRLDLRGQTPLWGEWLLRRDSSQWSERKLPTKISLMFHFLSHRGRLALTWENGTPAIDTTHPDGRYNFGWHPLH